MRDALHLARRELPLLAILLAAMGGLWAFVAVADAVIGEGVHAVDEALLLGLRNPADPADPLGQPWLEEFARDITALGSVGVLTILTLAVACFLALLGKRRGAVLLILAIGSGVALSFALKSGLDRPRPDLVPHAVTVQTTSFPSSHAMSSTVAYLTLGALLARLHRPRRVKAYVIAAAVLLALAIGVSRIYLGVHWPSDVLAGWIAGTVWALLCWTVALWLQRRRAVESDIEPAADDPTPR